MKNVQMQNRITWIVVLLLLGLLLYGILRRPETEEERVVRIDTLRHQAYDFAVSCSGTKVPRVTYDQIQWVVTPGTELVYQAVDGVGRFAGWADTATNTIWIPESNVTKRWIAKHEILHLLGYIGHPDHPFKTCRALPEQN
jgi:hypothetical protein